MWSKLGGVELEVGQRWIVNWGCREEITIAEVSPTGKYFRVNSRGTFINRWLDKSFMTFLELLPKEQE